MHQPWPRQPSRQEPAWQADPLPPCFQHAQHIWACGLLCPTWRAGVGRAPVGPAVASQCFTASSTFPAQIQHSVAAWRRPPEAKRLARASHRVGHSSPLPKLHRMATVSRHSSRGRAFIRPARATSESSLGLIRGGGPSVEEQRWHEPCVIGWRLAAEIPARVSHGQWPV